MPTSYEMLVKERDGYRFMWKNANDKSYRQKCEIHMLLKKVERLTNTIKKMREQK